MSNVKNLRKALQDAKVRLTQEQQAELDRRQWLEDMRSAMNAEQSDQFQNALKGLETGVRELVSESIEKAFSAHSEAVVAQIEALGSKIDGISFPDMPEAKDVDLSGVISEVKSLKRALSYLKPEKKQRVWSFDVERDRRGNIVRIHADGTAGES